MRLTKVHLAALAFVAGVLPAAVSADGWFSRMGDAKEVTLTDLLRTPREYVDVEVKFKVYFDATGDNYNPYYTRFNEECYGNFSAWPIDARLYDKRDFPRPYPFFFASKMTKAWKKVKDVDHLRVVQITGVVRDVFRGQPWIEVLSWNGASGGLSEDDVHDVVKADASYVAGRYKDAARLYERADSSSLPGTVRADLQRRLGDAYFRAGAYGDAQDAYELGLRYAPDNTVLKQGAEASETARQRAKAARRGQAVDGEMPEVAPAEEPVVRANGVDEVIRLLEDPATVQADVEAWRLELEQRAAALSGGTPEATAVAGTEPVAEEPADVVPVPAPEATEPVVEDEPVPTEGCAEVEATEGCGEQPAEQPESAEQPEGCAEQPAEQPESVETPAEQPAETVTEPVAGAEAGHEGCAETAEQPEGTPEGAEAAGCAEGTSDESATGTGEGACGDANAGTEGSSEASEQGSAEGCSSEQACGTEQGEETPAEETVAVTGEERVVWVSGQMVRLPRLPFFGCEDVTDDDLRAIIEEVVQNPESDE